MKTWVKMFAVAFVMTGCGSSTMGSGGSGGSGGAGGSGGSGGSGGTGGSGGGMVMTVHTLRTATPADGTMVTLQNVVVIGATASSKTGQMWVQDAGGGLQSGVHIFCNYGGTTPTCTNYTQPTWSAFVRSQIVSITGKVAHFTPTGAPPTAAQLELDVPTVTPGTGTMDPVAVQVPVAMVDKMGLTNETLKGSLVEVTGGPFAVASIMPMEFQASCTVAGGDAGMSTQYRGWELSSGSTTIAVATTFFNTFHWYIPNTCFAPPTGGTAVSNQTFHTLRGVVEPAYSTVAAAAFLQIQPVLDGDLAP